MKQFPVLFVVAALGGCATEPGSLLIDSTDRDGLEAVVESVFLRPIRHASVVGERSNATAFALHVGAAAGLNAAAALRFPLADSTGNPYLGVEDSLLEASLSLTSLRRRPLLGSQRVEVRLACFAWEEGSLFSSGTSGLSAIDSLACEGPALGELELDGGDTTTVVLSLDRELIEAWMSTPEENVGLVLQAGADSVLAALGASVTSTSPRLNLVTRSPDGRNRIFSIKPVEDTYTVATTDTSLFEAGADRLMIQNGLARRGLLEFDVSEIPPRSSVVGARLVLYPDATATFLFNPGFGLEVFEAVAENWTGEFPNLDVDDGGLPPAAGTTIDVFQGNVLLLDSLVANVQVPVQVWVNDSTANDGFLFRTTSEVGDLSYLSVLAGEAPEDSLPRLEVQYIVAPSGRFGGGS